MNESKCKMQKVTMISPLNCQLQKEALFLLKCMARGSIPSVPNKHTYTLIFHLVSSLYTLIWHHTFEAQVLKNS